MSALAEFALLNHTLNVAELVPLFQPVGPAMSLLDRAFIADTALRGTFFCYCHCYAYTANRATRVKVWATFAAIFVGNIVDRTLFHARADIKHVHTFIPEDN